MAEQPIGGESGGNKSFPIFGRHDLLAIVQRNENSKLPKSGVFPMVKIVEDKKPGKTGWVIGFGHDVTQEELDSGIFKDGLTIQKAIELFKKDSVIALENLGLEGADAEVQFLALDAGLRIGDLRKGAPKFLAALKAGNTGEAYVQSADIYYTSGGKRVFYKNRTQTIFDAIGFTPTDNQKVRFKKLREMSRLRGERVPPQDKGLQTIGGGSGKYSLNRHIL